MKNEEMLQELEERLKGLPTDDREKLIELYQDLIEVATENRKANTHLPGTLAEHYPLPIDSENESYPHIGRVILASISLFFFNLIFVLGPVITIFAVYLSLWIVSASFVLSPLFVVTQVVIGGFTTMELFLSLILCGIGIALGAGMVKAGKGLYKIFSTYVNWNIKLIKGE
ncbi:DUF1700 domain-containing protein [Neobacillus niacini]|uniref:DUF1700 domain-containing protein n=1 Tax=Neobacillus niacini TaxID=86668 RepID=UPI0021CB4481|nr:DUF1700 domain-containing protein [Neobacillus niacini]MCM3767601.1 DUF1700 domain-containing protein [Neobacillus niacini]